MTTLLVIGLLAAILVATALATGGLVRLLRRRAILDRPNERSLHVVPTPRGGGLAILAILVPAWAAVAMLEAAQPASPLAIAAGALVLAAVSWRDDVAGLSPAARLLAQALAIGFGLLALPSAGTVFQGLLPYPLDLAVSGLLWLWFVNLFNFMDGIDGIAASEAAAIGGGVALLAVAQPGLGAPLGLLGAALAAAALGFLVWNWQPARVFMGDVGSVPLGYLLGWLLLELAGAGLWAPAIILPLYFLVDASWTLLRRAARGVKIWQPHREHFYQRAVQAGRSHAAVVGRVVIADLVLVAAALWAASGAILPGLGLAILAVALLLLELTRARKPKPP